MDTPSFILIIVLVANLFLELLLLERAKKNSSVSVFTISVWTLIAWTLSIFFYRSVGPEYALLWGRILYISALLIPLTFLYFVLLFPSNTFTLSKRTVVLTVLPTILLVALIAFTNSIVQGVAMHPGQENTLRFGFLYPLYVLYISGYFLFALGYLFKKRQRAEGIEKLQIGYILIGTFISITLGSLFNLFLPSIGDFRFNWVGNVATLAMVSLITYAIVKERLFDIRVVLTQLFTGIIAVLLFINLVLSGSLFEYFWKGFLFVAFLIAGYLLVRSVMNEIKQREELQRAYAKLKELDEAKSEFVSIASHQLRTPLTAIKGYISMILEGSYGALNGTQERPMKSVYESNERLIRLVNDLLNISRIESGRIDMKWAQRSTADIIKSVIEEIGIKAQEKKLKLIFEKPEEPLPEISLDEEKIRNVLLNVVDNAIRYTKKGKIIIRTYVKQDASQKRKDLIIEVKDTGDGMTQEEINHLFESFSRGGAGTRMSTEGAGLGLYIAKQFMKLHKGKIWAESQGRGEGSTFFVELPVQ
jgi:signal transduction histidine kinase